ncbi:hypothetical protein [Geminisphaera colitermitum]|uniref:hypothetical protein n=1 Tax=Geminisphaera colitermitum TaxID=1148786 RepID=UPI0005B7EF17|nr:hypothetical protein [Geminisphaera colitermitum]
MNTISITGWLTRPAARAVSPMGRNVRLTFDLHTKDSLGQEFPIRCAVDDLNLIASYEPLLLPGKTVIVIGELTGRPFVKSGVTQGITKEILVVRAEFPNRGKRDEDGEEGGAE